MRMLLALRDTRTGSFLAPLTAATPGEAERVYVQILQTKGTLVEQYPRDFPLYEIGKYNEFTGEVHPLTGDDGKVALPRLLLEAGQLLGEAPLNLVKEG